MTQILKIIGVGVASGVAALLVFVGIILYLLPGLKGFGQFALVCGIILLVAYGILGIFGIIKRLAR